MPASVINATVNGLNATGGNTAGLELQVSGTTAVTINSTGDWVLTNPLPIASGGTGSATGTFSGANITSLNASNISTGTLGVARGGTGANTLTSEAVIIGNATSAVKFVAPGTSGNVLTSNGTVWASTAPAATGANTQSFTSSGTWTKPSGCTMVMVLLWGAGGSGGRDPAGGGGGGGGGGELTTVMIPAVLLPSTVSVTIGAGGTSPATNVTGNQGGSTTFGTYSDAVGGFGGIGGTSTGSPGGPGGGRYLGGYFDGSFNVAILSCGIGGTTVTSTAAAGTGYRGMAGSPQILRTDTNINSLFSYVYFNGSTASALNAGAPTTNNIKVYTYSADIPFTNLYSYGGGGGGGANGGSGLGGAGGNGVLAGAGGGGGSDTGTGGTGGTSSAITSFSTFTSVGGNGGSAGGAPTNGSGVGAGGGGAENQTAGSGSNGACIVYSW